MRCLSAGIAGFVIDATVSLLTQRGNNSLIHLGVHLAAFAVVGLIYVSYNPPSALRRIWREAELERYRSAMDELLTGLVPGLPDDLRARAGTQPPLGALRRGPSDEGLARQHLAEESLVFQRRSGEHVFVQTGEWRCDSSETSGRSRHEQRKPDGSRGH